MALVLAPEVPLRDWLEDLDAVSERSPGFFTGRPIIADVSQLKPSKSELKFLLAAFKMRNIRIIGLEGAAPENVDADMPPQINGGKPAGDIDVPDAANAAVAAAGTPFADAPVPEKSLLIEGSVLWAPSPRDRRSSRAVRSTSTARCAAAPSPAARATARPASSAANSRPS
jgi:septum site-determining protein MinC